MRSKLLPTTYVPSRIPPPPKKPRFPQADDQEWVSLARHLLLFLVSAGEKGASWKQMHTWRKSQPAGRESTGTMLRNCIAWLEDVGLTWYTYVDEKVRWHAKQRRAVRIVR